MSCREETRVSLSSWAKHRGTAGIPVKPAKHSVRIKIIFGFATLRARADGENMGRLDRKDFQPQRSGPSIQKVKKPSSYVSTNPCHSATSVL